MLGLSSSLGSWYSFSEYHITTSLYDASMASPFAYAVRAASDVGLMGTSLPTCVESPFHWRNQTSRVETASAAPLLLEKNSMERGWLRALSEVVSTTRHFMWLARFRIRPSSGVTVHQSSVDEPGQTGGVTSFWFVTVLPLTENSWGLSLVHPVRSMSKRQ